MSANYGKMDPEVKAKWVEALTSDRYRQVRYSLYQNGGFCCLGVLCDVMKIPYTIIDDAGREHREYLFKDHDEALAGIIPRGLYGITEIARGDLVEMNDRAQSPFEDIAKWIETNL